MGDWCPIFDRGARAYAYRAFCQCVLMSGGLESGEYVVDYDLLCDNSRLVTVTEHPSQTPTMNTPGQAVAGGPTHPTLPAAGLTRSLQRPDQVKYPTQVFSGMTSRRTHSVFPRATTSNHRAASMVRCEPSMTIQTGRQLMPQT